MIEENIQDFLQVFQGIISGKYNQIYNITSMGSSNSGSGKSYHASFWNHDKCLSGKPYHLSDHLLDHIHIVVFGVIFLARKIENMKYIITNLDKN